MDKDKIDDHNNKLKHEFDLFIENNLNHCSYETHFKYQGKTIYIINYIKDRLMHQVMSLDRREDPQTWKEIIYVEGEGHTNPFADNLDRFVRK